MYPQQIIDGINIAREFKELSIFYSDNGSISIRDKENMWITKSGKEKYSDNSFTLVDHKGNPLTDKEIKLSGEYPIHKLVLDENKKYNSIIHTHSPFHVAFGNVFPNYCFDQEALEMRKLLDHRDPNGSFTLKTIPNSFNKEELAKNVSKALDNNIAVLIQGHGLFVAGANIHKARDYVMAIDQLMHQIHYEIQLRK